MIKIKKSKQQLSEMDLPPGLGGEVKQHLSELCTSLRNGNVDEAKEQIIFFNDEDKGLILGHVLEAARVGLCEKLKLKHSYETQYLVQFVKDEFGVTSKDLYTDGIIEAARVGLCEKLKDGDLSASALVELVQFLKDEFGVTSKDLYTEEVLEAARIGLCEKIRFGHNPQELVQFLKDEFEFTSKDLYTEGVIEATKAGIRRNITDYYSSLKAALKLAQFVKNEFKINGEDLYIDEVLEATRKELYCILKNGYASDAQEFVQSVKDTFKVNGEDFCTDEVLKAARERFNEELKKCHAFDSIKLVQLIKNEFKVNVEDQYIDKVIKVAKKGICDALQWGCSNKARELFELVTKEFKVNGKDLYTEKVPEAARTGLYENLRNGKISEARDLIQFVKDKFEVNYEDLYTDLVPRGVRAVLRGILEYGELSKAQELFQFVKDSFHIKDEDLYTDEVLKVGCRAITNLVRDTRQKKALKLLDFMREKYGDTIKITEGHFKLVKERNYIDLYTVQKALEEGVDLNNKEKFFDFLLKHEEAWLDSQISDPFKKGVECFGLECMFEYIGESCTSLHDKMIGFEDICRLCDQFGTTEKIRGKFYYNILEQVKMDGAQYNEGTSYHHLNAIAGSLKDTSIADILERAKGLEKGLPEIVELVNYFNEPIKIIASWKDLKKFMKLKGFVDDEDIANELREIRKNDEKLYEFAKVLLFYRHSTINSDAVREFLYDPESFFARGDKHSDDIHDDIKPSNFYRYGLSAIDLRRAMVNGAMDEIQEIRPMEIEYDVFSSELPSELISEYEKTKGYTTLDYLRYALGRKKDGIEGKASNSVKIFNGLRKLGIDVSQIFNDNFELSIKLESGESKDLEPEVRNILRNDEAMRKIIDLEAAEYRIQIHRKSDPMAALAGDATACCMAWGSGKGIIYGCTPNNAICSVQKKIDGEYRTIAQCVMTLDVDTGVTGIRNLEDISKIPVDALQKKLVLTCDNIEVAPNFKNEARIIEEGLRHFFKPYMDVNAESMGIESGRVIIGTGWSDAFNDLPKIDNTFIPTSLLGYSDNRGAKSYLLDLDLDLDQDRKWSFIETKRVTSKKDKSEKSGEYTIKDICLSDILKISRLENDVYGASLKEGMVEMQNTITAYLIKNALSGKEGFMFKMMGKGDMLSSYMIGTEESDENGMRVHIADFASKGNNNFLNGRMISKFIEKYKAQYGEDDILPPVVAEFRERTTYKIIENEERLNKFLRHYGLRAKVEKYGTEKRGGEIFRKCCVYVLRQGKDASRVDEMIKGHRKKRTRKSYRSVI